MTVSKEYNKHVYTGNGLTVDWPFDFDLPVTAAGDPDTSLIHVFRTNLRGEVSDVTAFSIDSDTGTLTYPTSGSPLEAGEKVTILRLLDVTQQFFDPSNQANLYPETLEDNTDRLVMMIQQLQEETDRAVKVSVSTDLETEDTTAEGIFEARDIARAAAETAEGYANQLPAIADELGVNLVTDEADLRAKLTTIGAAKATLVIATAIPLTDDLSIPSNVSLSFKNTGQLQPASGTTLTINGPIDAGLWQIFGGEGTVTGTPDIHYVYPEWFGAVGDGVTDDTDAIKAVIAIPCVVHFSREYLISNTITLNGNMCKGMEWEGKYTDNRLLYNGDGTAMEVYGLLYVSGFTFRVVKASKDWKSNDAGADRTSTGIHFIQAADVEETYENYEYLQFATRRSSLFIEYSSGFAMGVRFSGIFALNTVQLGIFTENYIGVYFDGPSTYAWQNENHFIGGEISNDRPPSYPELIDGSCFMHLNGSGNSFYGLCMQNNQSVDYIVTGDGSSNTFIGCRLEGAKAGSIDLINTMYGSYPNMWVGGYELGISKFTERSYYANSILGPESWLFGGRSGNGIYMTNAQSSSTNKSIFKTGYTSGEDPWTAGKGLSMDVKANSIRLYTGGTYPYPKIAIVGSDGHIMFGTGLADNGWGTTAGIGATTSDHKLYVSGSNLLPIQDDYTDLGVSDHRFDNIYATNDVINTSDEREKQDIRDLSDAEKAVAVRIKGLMKAFRFKSAVEKKGDDARIHVGAIAQEVAQAFRDEGLDPARYAMFCYDEWDEQPEVRGEEGNIIEEYHPAGNRYGLRYNELLAFVIGAMQP